MKKFTNNSLKKKFLEQFPTISLENSDIKDRCKFNLSFFDDSQQYASSFASLRPDVLTDIVNKIKAYTRNDLNYWRNQRTGGHGLKILADYETFPKKSNFTHPKFVPHDVSWCRFRMENLSRLIGFTVPGSQIDRTNKTFPDYDLNTFYLVFIDLDHNFYLTESK